MKQCPVILFLMVCVFSFGQSFPTYNRCVSDRILQYLRRPCYGDVSKSGKNDASQILNSLEFLSRIILAKTKNLGKKYASRLHIPLSSDDQKHAIQKNITTTEDVENVAKHLQHYFATLHFMAAIEIKQKTSLIEKITFETDIRIIERNILTMLCGIERYIIDIEKKNNIGFAMIERQNMDEIDCDMENQYVLKSANFLFEMANYFNSTVMG